MAHPAPKIFPFRPWRKDSHEADRLGDFQYRFLRAIVRLGTQAFGPAIHEALEAELEHRINPGQIYQVANRLAEQDLLRTKENQVFRKTGRHATLFICTDEGHKALQRTRAYYKKLIGR